MQQLKHEILRKYDTNIEIRYQVQDIKIKIVYINFLLADKSLLANGNCDEFNNFPTCEAYDKGEWRPTYWDFLNFGLMIE